MTTPVSLAFGVLLKRYRLAANLTQEGLAERARVSARVVSDLERDPQRLPRQATLAQLADALGLVAAERARFLTAAHMGSEPAELRGPVRGAALPVAPTPLVGREAE